jgi:hypothetical protein
MLLVKTKIGPSKVAGIGLFAHEFIAKGTPVWKFMSDFDQKISEKKTAEFSESARGQFLNYAYFNQKTGWYILCGDDARFCNHSSDSNIVSTYPPGESEEGVSIAVRDILKGEEIMDNYEEFDGDFMKKDFNHFKDGFPLSRE